MAGELDASSKVNDMHFKEVDNLNSSDNFNIEIDLNINQSDDTELVDAFDKAVKQAKEEILERRPDLKELVEDTNKTDKNVKTKRGNTRGKYGKKNKTAWATGKNCRAVFSGDRQEYEAVICFINHETGDCTVKFLGYGNKESVPINTLKPSHGKGAVFEQKRQAAVNNEKIPSELNESFFSPSISNDERKFQTIHSSNLNTPPSFNVQDNNMPPMPPPSFLSGLPIDQSDSLSSVLMAWYMAGYHTGRYEATLNFKQNKPFINH